MRKNAITGYQIPLLEKLTNDLNGATKVKFIVSFIMESGVKILLPFLEELAHRNVSIHILTGTYLNITQPSAIYLLKHKLGDCLDIRFYNDNGISFHPKGYLIEKEDDAIGYIGSSNISHSALLSGVEWNYRFLKSRSTDEYIAFDEMFNNLFANHSNKVTDDILQEYASKWKKSVFYEEIDGTSVSTKIEPRGAQLEALYCLTQARREGIQKGIVIAATGIGKTYLAAFDSKDFRRVLFIAHREEILKQAAHSFKMVRPNNTCGFFYGSHKDHSADILLATVQTLGQEPYLTNKYFAPDAFDYIVIDEFHHAVAASYQKIFAYFKPKFLLGLTATPFRMDNRDIFSLCDNNVIYEIYLRDSINRGYLVPFRYYAFYDETNYEAIPNRNGHYELQQLEQALSTSKRTDLVLEKYKQYAGKKTLGFCAGIQHAEYMVEFFNRNKVSAAVVHSGTSESKYFMQREEAILALQSGKVKVLFTVDLFNEGVDIPEVDTVLFLRPTESFIVFLQQLGRGLRKLDTKKELIILDFIGNYKRAHQVPFLLAGHNPLSVDNNKGIDYQKFQYPEGCIVNFDFRIIDLFMEMRKKDPLKQRLHDEYWRIHHELQHRPSRLHLFEESDIPIKYYLADDGWLGFLSSINELTDKEKSWPPIVANFLREMERTSMAKSYKIPTLLCFLADDGTWIPQVDKTRLATVWRNYYANGTHSKDMARDNNTKSWDTWDDTKLAKLAIRNPVYYLSHTEYFSYDEVNQIFYMDERLSDYLTPALATHFKDILTWRSRNYFSKRYKEEN